METKKESIYTKDIHPFKQAGAALVAALLFMILGQLIVSVNLMDFGERFPWTVAGAFILMYSIFNSVSSFSAKNLLFYYRNSLFGFAGLLFLSSGLAYLFSGILIGEAGTFKWIFLMLTMTYFTFIGITLFIRFILSALETEEDKLR